MPSDGTDTTTRNAPRSMPPRVLLLVGATSYRADAFLAAARRLGVDVVIGTDPAHVGRSGGVRSEDLRGPRPDA